MLPSDHVVGIILFFHILHKKRYRIYDVRIGSALKISAGKVSFPGALLFFKVLIAAIISNFDGSSVLISKSVFASGICFLL